MPKILKTVTAEKIYSFPAYKRFVTSGKHFGEYNSLADNGEIFIIRGDSESKEWFAWRCHSPQVADKIKTTNFSILKINNRINIH